MLQQNFSRVITCLQFSTISVNMNSPSTISIDDGGRGEIHPHQSYPLEDINIDQSYNSIHQQDNVSTDYVDIPHPQTNEAYSSAKTTSPQDYAPNQSVPTTPPKQRKGVKGVYRCIPPPFIVKPTRSIQRLKILHIRLPSPKIQTRNLKITPKVTSIVFSIPPLSIVHQEIHGVPRSHELWVFATELFGCFPECGDGFNVFGEGHDKRVDFVVFAHKSEGVVGDGTVKVDVGFYAPVPGVFEEEGVTEEEARVIATHMSADS
jgi:hypothetical protein